MKLSNVLRWVNRTIAKYDKSLYLLMLLSAISNTVFVMAFAIFPKFILQMMSEGTKDTEAALRMVAAFSLIVLISKIMISYTAEYSAAHFMRCRMRMIGDMGKRFMKRKYYDIESAKFMDLSQKADTAVNGCSPGYEAVLNRLTIMSGHVFTCILSLGAVITFHPILMVFIFFIVFLNRLIGEKSKQEEKKLMDSIVSDQRKSDYYFDLMSDFQFGKEIRLYHFSANIFRKFQNIIKSLRQQKIKIYKNSAHIKVLLSVIAMIQEIAIYAVMTSGVLHNKIDIGSYLAYIALTAAFSNALNLVMEDFVDLKYQSMYVNDLIRFFETMDQEETPGKKLIREMDLTNWEITFDHVSFRYPDSACHVLNDFSIKIRKGEKIAITGLNGAGKTTFIKLLTRLYDPVEGRICINQVNIQEFSREDYYALFAPLFQEVFLFPFSVNENVALAGKEEIDYQLAEQKAREVGLHDKIQSLPLGMKTSCLKILDEEGVQFSGGEQQKLLLARTLYKDREIFIFDEPTAALDPLAENKIYQDFNEMTRGKTAIFITHRLASTRFCDAIYVFGNGGIIEYGTHDGLREKKGTYSHLFELQAKNYRMGDRSV